jgi:aspartate racemase
MRTIGLIGGMSWESTAEYYKLINETAKEKLGGLHSAKCLLYSVDFAEIENLQHQDNWLELSTIMVNAALKLKLAGAEFIVICTNTMHKLASDIEEYANIKVLHIAEMAGRKIRQQGMKRVGLLGTKFTMEQDFYKMVLKERFNIDVVIPDKQDREIIHEVIYTELCKGIIAENSKIKYKEIINKLVLNGAEGVVLGCTEIPLLIKQKDVTIPIFDTTAIHAIAAAEFAINS